jgi:membrane protein YdbS with pleckstrin-like domain
MYIWLCLAIFTLISTVFVYFEFHKKSYAIRQKDIVYNSGLFWRSSIVIPFNRVQHCEVSQGPIDRFYKLAELKVFTAGGASSDLSISGLSPESAARIKDFLVIKTGIDEEE